MTDDLLRQVAQAADTAWQSQAAAIRSAARAILLLLAWALAVGSRSALVLGNMLTTEERHERDLETASGLRS